jgi:predicted phage terminase large subunit-like protein
MRDFRDLLRARPLVAEHLRKDFGAFCRACWPHLHAGAKLNWTPGHDLIAEHLVATWQGQFKRLIINCPPRYGKSSIVTILWPIWLWLQSPTLAFLACSYEIDLSTNHNLDRRKLMDSKWFRDLFGNFFQLATDRSQAGEFQNTAGGLMQAASVNSKAQGRGGDYLIIDDPLSADAAFSETFRNETNSWFLHQLPQRLNNPNESRIVIVMQRLHQNDPAGFLLGQEESEWTLLKLPLVAEEDETWRFPISGRVWRRPKGTCLDPKRWSSKVIKERQRNRLIWAGQFQQNPASAEGNLIRVDEIMFYGGRDPVTGIQDPSLPDRFDRKIISVDCSFKGTSGADFVAVIVVGVLGARRYLLHVTNAHLDLTGTENEIRNARALFAPISAVLVEETANGAAIVSRLKEEIPALIGVAPEGGKMSRMQATAPEFQARNWFIERNGPWAHKITEQLTMFPVGKNDDISDAISQAAIWLQQNTYELGFVDFLKNLASGKGKPAASTQTVLQSKAVPKTGPVQARSEGSKGQPPSPPPCEACRATCTVWTSGGIPGHPFAVRCNQCGAIDGVVATSELGCAAGCPAFLPQIVSGRTRCGNCGAYHTAAPPALGAVSRAQYEARRWDRLRRFM